MPKRRFVEDSNNPSQEPPKKEQKTSGQGLWSQALTLPGRGIDAIAGYVVSGIVSIERYFAGSPSPQVHAAAKVLVKEILSKFSDDAKTHYARNWDNLEAKIELLKLVQEELVEPLHDKFDNSAFGEEAVNHAIGDTLQDIAMLNQCIDTEVTHWKYQYLNHLECLPIEMLQAVVSYLPLSSVASLAQTSKYFDNAISGDNGLRTFKGISMSRYYAALRKSLLDEAQSIVQNWKGGLEQYIPEELKRADPLSLEELDRLLDECNERLIRSMIQLDSIRLNLSKIGLTRLPKPLLLAQDLQSYWRALRELNLDNNQISTIPAEIGRLVALHELLLYNNQISTIPVEIGNLVALRGESLDLRVNHLTQQSLAPFVQRFGQAWVQNTLMSQKVVAAPQPLRP